MTYTYRILNGDGTTFGYCNDGSQALYLAGIRGRIVQRFVFGQWVTV